jgi:hypothetical protein
VREVIGVHGIVQREGAVAETPVVTHALLLVKYEVGHADRVELGCKGETIVPATN